MANANQQSRIKDVKRRIVPVNEVDPYLRILVFARNKKGKTVFGASGPKTLIIDINEKGTKSVSDSKADVFEAKTWEDMTYVYWFLRSGNHNYEVFVLDTVTQMQHMCLKFVLKESEDRDPNKDPSTPIQRDWLKMAELMKPMLLNFRNLPMHAIFLAQERNMDNDDGENERVPDLSPSVRGTATASVDVIGRMFMKEVRVVDRAKKKETKRWMAFMLCGPHETYPTGNRIGLPRVVRNPTVPMFIEALEEFRNG